MAFEVYPAPCSVGIRPLSPGVKQPGHEADHSPTSVLMLKKEYNYTSTSSYAVVARTGTTTFNSVSVFSRLPLFKAFIVYNFVLYYVHFQALKDFLHFTVLP
jgi:hypothetical protein